MLDDHDRAYPNIPSTLRIYPRSNNLYLNARLVKNQGLEKEDTLFETIVNTRGKRGVFVTPESLGNESHEVALIKRKWTRGNYTTTTHSIYILRREILAAMPEWKPKPIARNSKNLALPLFQNTRAKDETGILLTHERLE